MSGGPDEVPTIAELKAWAGDQAGKALERLLGARPALRDEIERLTWEVVEAEQRWDSEPSMSHIVGTARRLAFDRLATVEVGPWIVSAGAAKVLSLALGVLRGLPEVQRDVWLRSTVGLRDEAWIGEALDLPKAEVAWCLSEGWAAFRVATDSQRLPGGWLGSAPSSAAGVAEARSDDGVLDLFPDEVLIDGWVGSRRGKGADARYLRALRRRHGKRTSELIRRTLRANSILRCYPRARAPHHDSAVEQVWATVAGLKSWHLDRPGGFLRFLEFTSVSTGLERLVQAARQLAEEDGRGKATWGPAAGQIVDPVSDPSELECATDEVIRASARLAPPRRDVWILSWFVGCDVPEIAQDLQLPAWVVEAHLASVKAELGVPLEEQGAFGLPFDRSRERRP